MLRELRKIFEAFSKTERRFFRGAAAVFALAALAGGLNVFYSRTVVAPLSGGEYTEAVVGQPIAINPLISAGNDADRDLMEIAFTDLWDLIAGHELSEDQKIWTLDLKENLRWSDGEPLTANDIVFTVEAIQNPETGSPLAAAWRGVKAEKISESQARFTLKTPYVFFSDNLKSLKIVPAHIFGTIPRANLKLSDYNLEPVGSGPYSFVSYEKRKDGFINEYRFQANEFYSGEPALIQELKFRFFASNDEALAALNSREVDGLGGLSPAALSQILIGHQVKELKMPRYYAIFFNQSVAPALKHKEIREALTLAVDKKTIAAETLENRALVVNGPLFYNIEGFDPLLNESRFSPEAAEALLEENGWLKEDDGVRAKSVNKELIRLEFEIIVPEIDFLERTAGMVRNFWQAMGVKADLTILNPAEITSQIIKTRNYQMIIFGNILKDNPDIFSFWHSSERFHPGLNLALYESKDADILLESVRRNFDPESRREDLMELQKTIISDMPAIFLFSPNYLYAAPKDLGGFEASLIAAPANRFDDVNRWFLKTARVFK